MAKDDAYYGIDSQVFVTNVSKARDLDQELLKKISDLHLKISLELPKAFDLRRKEAIKFSPDYADRNTYIRLISTWCKGGRARQIPMRTDEQRDVLRCARLLCQCRLQSIRCARRVLKHSGATNRGTCEGQRPGAGQVSTLFRGGSNY